MTLIVEHKWLHVLNLSDHCHNLRKRIKTGMPVAEEEHRYIDSKEYWKDQCARFEREKRELEGKLAFLEQRQQPELVEQLRQVLGSDVDHDNNHFHRTSPKLSLERAPEAGRHRRHKSIDRFVVANSSSSSITADDNLPVEAINCRFIYI